MRSGIVNRKKRDYVKERKVKVRAKKGHANSKMKQKQALFVPVGINKKKERIRAKRLARQYDAVAEKMGNASSKMDISVPEKPMKVSVKKPLKLAKASTIRSTDNLDSMEA